jgi:quercetin dioxygenase-like cupin family protein
MTKRALVATFAPAAAVAVCAVLAVPAEAAPAQILAEGPVKALPPGEAFLSVVDFPQPAGASYGPHGHVPGFVYVLSGKAMITDENGSKMVVSSGEGHFIPALAVHTHENSDNRLPAGALAVGLVIAVIALVLVAASRRAPAVLVTVLLAAIIAGGAVALWDPWKNDWFFIAVRPESARGGLMPIPRAARTYESPTFSRVPPGPYTESLATATVDPDSQMAEPEAPGPVVFLVLDGRADVIGADQERIGLGHHEATLVQTGEAVRIENPGETVLRLLRFALIPQGSSP